MPTGMVGGKLSGYVFVHLDYIVQSILSSRSLDMGIYTSTGAVPASVPARLGSAPLLALTYSQVIEIVQGPTVFETTNTYYHDTK